METTTGPFGSARAYLTAQWDPTKSLSHVVDQVFVAEVYDRLVRSADGAKFNVAVTNPEGAKSAGSKAASQPANANVTRLNALDSTMPQILLASAGRAPGDRSTAGQRGEPEPAG